MRCTAVLPCGTAAALSVNVVRLDLASRLPASAKDTMRHVSCAPPSAGLRRGVPAAAPRTNSLGDLILARGAETPASAGQRRIDALPHRAQQLVVVGALRRAAAALGLPAGAAEEREVQRLIAGWTVDSTTAPVPPVFAARHL
jgi:hypothetical protein